MVSGHEYVFVNDNGDNDDNKTSGDDDNSDDDNADNICPFLVVSVSRATTTTHDDSTLSFLSITYHHFRYFVFSRAYRLLSDGLSSIVSLVPYPRKQRLMAQMI